MDIGRNRSRTRGLRPWLINAPEQPTISVDLGDGAGRRSRCTPYDVIVVSGSMAAIPPAMLAQLRIGGRALAVVGRAPAMEQMVTHYFKDLQFFGVLETVLGAPLDHAPTADFSF